MSACGEKHTLPPSLQHPVRSAPSPAAAGAHPGPTGNLGHLSPLRTACSGSSRASQGPAGFRIAQPAVSHSGRQVMRDPSQQRPGIRPQDRWSTIDGILEHSPAEHVRRPSVPAELPTLGFTHLQFEALLTAARESPKPYDFALVAMLGLLGLRIFEATGADISDLAGVEEKWFGQGRGERSHTGARLVSASRNERQPAAPQHSARTPRSCRPSAQTPCSGVRSRCPFGAVLAVPYTRMSHWYGSLAELPAAVLSPARSDYRPVRYCD